MNDLEIIIKKIKVYVSIEREKNQLNKVDYFFLSMLEISTILTELGIQQGRRISLEEEQNWFKGSYHLDFWDATVNQELYQPLCKKVSELHFFRVDEV